ncbi:sensor histidine kinase [Pararhizobium arenae]|uniref:sensor histidine kinase n=1 Tax=Pararhizobium arenae TaxID=1856850 RepID=UPI00094B369D|nr:histidine kinase dimerization/phosphoacceptor domain -containing protein [Pararhizobium arenae]
MAAVRRYDVLDTPPDGMFDSITALAARRCKVPIAIISTVDNDRIWFKSHHGLSVEQIDREPGLCASAILADDPYILENAVTDMRSLANPLVAGDFGLKFYAAVPLRTHDGFNLGTLCILDKEVRTIDQEQIADLKDLASIVMDQLELRLSARRAVATAEMLAKEIDHRVMNSLQFVSTMLTMQGRSPDAAPAADALRDAANRVGAVARVHRHSYAKEHGEDVSSAMYLGRLCEDLSGIVGRPVQVSADDIAIPLAALQPIGLIVNELVTNAAKHGEGTITVTYFERNGEIELAVSDEGSGLPDDFDVSRARGLGMKVVSSLATQLQGRFDVQPRSADRAARLAVFFPTPSSSS